jgi:photosystem II stability/assembly factor-like uncharacterized protein
MGIRSANKPAGEIKSIQARRRLSMQHMAILRKVFCIIFLSLCFTSQVGFVSAKSDTWTSIGPEGGTIPALAIDPATPTTLYAGTAGGGVFKSTNGGANWNTANTGLGNFCVTALVIDPLTPTTIYATTQGGVFKSTNGGGNWSMIGFSLWYGYVTLDSLVIDPITPTTLYSETMAGVYKSADGGENWTVANTGIEGAGYIAHLLTIDPITPTTLYAMVGGSLYKTINGGGNWSEVSSDLDTAGEVYVLVVDPATLYAGTASGVYKSTNGGFNWSKAGTGPGSTLALVIDPATPTTLYAGTQLYNGVGGVFKSTNGGGNWTQVNSGINPSQTTVLSLSINPLTPSTLYAGTSPIYGRNDGGIFKSTNGGGNWSASKTNLMNTNIGVLTIDPVAPTTLYAGSHTEGIYKSTNGGGSWSVINNGLPFLRVISSLAVDPLTPTTLYAGTGSLGVYKSTNGGGNWGEVNTGLNVIQGEYYISALAIDPTTPATLYAGTGGGVVKSTNGGGNWSAVNTGLTNKDVRTLVIDPVTPTTLYAGTYLDSIFKSTNGGGSWVEININLICGLRSTDTVNTFAINPVTPNTVYAGTDSCGVYKSTNGGENWSPVNNGLPSNPSFDDYYLSVNTLAIDPLTPTTLYAGLGGGPGSATYPELDGGVFKSTDSGGSWNPVGSGLTTFYINALAINPAAPADLYAATNGGGIAALNNTPVTTYALSATKEGTGTGTINSSPTGIDCGFICSYDFVYNTVVTLTATPTSPATFGGWSGAGCSGADTCTLTMSSAQSVTATFNLPGNYPPSLTYPTDGLTLNTTFPTFTWETVNGATSYNIQVSKTSSFSSTIVNATMTSPSYTAAKAFAPKTTLYWRVRTNSSSGTSDWSDVYSFTTGNPPSVPSLSKPSKNGLVTNRPFFDWKDSKLPTGTTLRGYQIQVSTSSTFDTTVLDVGGTAPYITTSNYTPTTDLSPATLYYWRVRSYNTAGDYSGWSQVRTFRTQYAAPVLIGPSGATTLRPTFTWNVVSGATAYKIQVSTVNIFKPTVVSATIVTNSYTMTKDLLPAKTYYWRVQALGTFGPGVWSGYITITTP